MTRFLQIKRVLKLCSNTANSSKKDHPSYNPAYKYDLLYDVLIHNINAITKYADLDQCGDETTWAHGGYGESGTGLQGRITGKPGVTKGGQIVILSDAHRYRPRAYVHQHKLHSKPEGWNVMGQVEVRLICEKLQPMVVEAEAQAEEEEGGGKEQEGKESERYLRSSHV